MPFSPSQSRAIAHGKGPAIVLAGPGSGKTLVITNRTAYLIQELNVRPEEILVITFTKAAALEMKERFLRLCGGERTRVTFGTFHAVFFTILRYAYHYEVSNIIREEQRFALLQELTQKYRLEFEDERELIRDITGEISVVKNEQIALEHYYSTTCSAEIFRNIFREYQDTLVRMGLIDFDDMLVYCWQLFKERPDILAQWQKKYRYILVDEFQDINHLQYEVIRMMAQPGNNLFVVGDDDQSIYRFRGAKPEIMLNFRKDYPDAQIMQLEENYRSTREIIHAAQLVIRENENRYRKKVTTTRGSGTAVEIRRFKDQNAEALYLVDRIRKAKENGCDYRDMAILTRTNIGGRYIAEVLSQFSIPLRMRDLAPSLYDHWITQDIFAYLRLGLGIRERKDFLMVMNKPKRYISRECVEGQVVDMERLRTWYEDKPWMVRRIDKLEEDLDRLRFMKPYAAVNYIRFGLEYEQYLKEYAEYRRIRFEELVATLDEIQESAKPFKSTMEWFEHIEDYRKQLEEQKDKRNQDPDEDAVTMATMHSAKGLEFAEVFLPDLNEDVIPHRKSFLEPDVEEERRLMYVGMTRAKDKLHMYYLKEKYGKEQMPTRFLEVFDLPE